MGPMMAVGGMKEERSTLTPNPNPHPHPHPHLHSHQERCVERGADGPYPYAVGMLQVLSRKA